MIEMETDMSYASMPHARQHDDETRRFADQPQAGFHLFKSNGVWVATGRGKAGYGEGRTGRQDAINQLYGRTRFVSPLKKEGFHDFDPGEGRAAA